MEAAGVAKGGQCFQPVLDMLVRRARALEDGVARAGGIEDRLEALSSRDCRRRLLLARWIAVPNVCDDSGS